MRAKEAMREYGGVVRVADHPELRSAWSRRATAGAVVRALPGVVMEAERARDPLAWVRAVHAWDPNAVIAGRAAAHLAFAPELVVDQVGVYTIAKVADRGMLRFVRHALHPDLTDWLGELRVTTPAASALTAAIAGDYDTATTALRESAVRPYDLVSAARLLKTRPADTLRGVLRDLSGNPWSVAEVDAHRLLRAGGISGWVGNYRVVVDGRSYFVDIAFPEARVGIEINSFAFHSSREAMARDAAKTNSLLSAGWRLYTLLPDQVTNLPEETLDWLRDSLRRRDQRRGQSGVLRAFTSK